MDESRPSTPRNEPTPEALPRTDVASRDAMTPGEGWSSGLGTTTKLKVIFSDAGRLTGLPHGPRALIVGAGVSGLTAAIALHRAGWRVAVHESRLTPGIDDASDACLGVSIGAAGVAALRTIGADVGVLAAGEPIRQRRVMLASGRIVRETSAAAEELEHGVPGVMLTRADLLGALRSHIGEELIHTGHTFAGVEEEALAAAVRVRDVHGVDSMRRADAVLGADGALSGVRASIAARAGAQPTAAISPDALRWQVIFGMADAPLSLYPGGLLTRVWGHGTRMGIMRVPPRRREIASPHRVAWWLVREVWGHSPTSADGAALRRDALAMTDGWWPVARELIRATSDAQLKTMVATTDTHAALHAAGRGRVALLGDAAHPLWPLIDDAIALAIRDAMQATAVLADVDASEIVHALRGFESRRDVHVRHAIRRARLLTPLRSPLLAGLREGLLRVMPGRLLAASLEGRTTT